MFSSNRLDTAYCEKMHAAIHDHTPVLLTLFNNDAFGHDTYIELHYTPDESFAHLYFSTGGVDKVCRDFLLSRDPSSREFSDVPSTSVILSQINPYPYLNTVRLCRQESEFILEILEECQGVQFTPDNIGRDGNIVTLKSFWKKGALFCYWVSPAASHTRVAELIWLLSSYLPRPARDSLQSGLSNQEVQRLQHKLQIL